MSLSPKLLTPIIMAFIMAAIMTSFITWVNLGATPDYFYDWGKAFLMAWPLASVAAFIAGPIAPKIAMRIANKVNGTSKDV